MARRGLIKSSQEIDWLRKAGQIHTIVLKELIGLASTGVTTESLDRHARARIYEMGGQCPFLGYQGFPGAVCISINQELVHGIPDQTKLREGDLLKLDLGVSYQDMIVDGALTIVVDTPEQQIDPDVRRLLTGTRKALVNIKNILRPGISNHQISIEIARILKKYQLYPADNLTGHGVGYQIHENPAIPNALDLGIVEVKLPVGAVIAIEPIASLGTRSNYLDSDGWTYVTADQSLAAHYEDTILITESGCEFLTKSFDI